MDMQASKEKLDELVKRVIEAVHPLQIILFGSTARGEAGRYSDIDLLVIVPDGTHRRKTAQIIYRHLFGFDIPVDVVIATPSDIEKYKDSPGLIYREALRGGRELYAA
jgi:uncharacterized protein